MSITRHNIPRYPLADITLAPNPRPSEHINPASIDEMADSILEQGIIQPPLAREHEGRIQLYIGQRRFLGAKRALEKAMEQGQPEERIAELRELPLIVRDIDDRTMLEQQWVENLQREDVTVRDEAVGFDQMNRTLGYTLEQIGAKIGKTKQYISNRLALIKAPESLWAAFEAGTVGTRHLELVGRIPHPKDREEAAKAILKPNYQNRPMSVVETSEMISNTFVASLRACGFDKKDAALVPMEYKDGERVMGGACVDCPFLAANAPDMADELGGGASGTRGSKRGIDQNLCMNPRCFTQKQGAAWKALKANAEAVGRRVMEADQAAQVFENYGERAVSARSGLVDLSAQPGYEETGHYDDDEDKVPAWEDLLKGTEAERLAIVTRHPKTGKVTLLLEREKAIELAVENDGKTAKIFENRPKPQKAAKSGKSTADKAKQEMDRGRKVREAHTQLVMDGIEDRLSQKGLTTTAAEVLVRMAFHRVAEEDDSILDLCGQMKPEDRGYMDSDELWELCKTHIVPDTRTVDGCVKWMALLLCQSELNAGGWQGISSMERLCELAKALKVDVTKLEEQAEAAVAATEKKPAEKLVTCPTCGTANFTERGLKAHVCKGKKKEEEAVRGVDDYKCDKCGAGLYVPPGQGAAVACFLKKGEMLCTKHGGTWEKWESHEQAMGLTPKKKTKKSTRVDESKHAIDADVKAKARKLYDAGKGKDVIAKELGISPNTVGNWQKREWPKRGSKK